MSTEVETSSKARIENMTSVIKYIGYETVPENGGVLLYWNKDKKDANSFKPSKKQLIAKKAFASPQAAEAWLFENADFDRDKDWVVGLIKLINDRNESWRIDESQGDVRLIDTSKGDGEDYVDFIFGYKTDKEYLMAAFTICYLAISKITAAKS